MFVFFFITDEKFSGLVYYQHIQVEFELKTKNSLKKFPNRHFRSHDASLLIETSYKIYPWNQKFNNGSQKT